MFLAWRRPIYSKPYCPPYSTILLFDWDASQPMQTFGLTTRTRTTLRRAAHSFWANDQQGQALAGPPKAPCAPGRAWRCMPVVHARSPRSSEPGSNRVVWRARPVRLWPDPTSRGLAQDIPPAVGIAPLERSLSPLLRHPELG